MPQDGGSSPVRFGHGARQIELGNGCGCRIKRTHPIKEKPESRSGTSDDVASRQSALRRWAEHVEHIRQAINSRSGPAIAKFPLSAAPKASTRRLPTNNESAFW